jgi:Winged helix DNA-binding domain
MVTAEIMRQRLAQQRISQNPFRTPAEVVDWLGAVQSQEYLGAIWSLGLRMESATDGMIERAFNEGKILRTHVMRPTWHFVTPADIRWLLEFTASRLNAANASRYRQLELDEALLRRSNDLIAQALQGGQMLTRAELGAALAEAGILAKGLRLIYILFRSELDGVVCSGPRRGKQFTYALLDERAPHARSLPRDAALAELVRRYFTGHGPASVHDFAWWSGLTVGEAKAGLEMVGSDLTRAVIDGQTYYISASMRQVEESPDAAYLLPTFDEILVGFSAFDKLRSGGQDLSQKVVFDPRIVMGGRIVGSWRRTFKKGAVVVEIAPFNRLTTAEDEAIAAAAQGYGDFLGMPAILQMV